MTNDTGVGGHIKAKSSFEVAINEYVSLKDLHPPNQKIVTPGFRSLLRGLTM